MLDSRTITLFWLLALLPSCGFISEQVQIGSLASMDQEDAALPIGSVLPFDGAVCPQGWSAFSEGNGRMLVGSGIGTSNAYDSSPLTQRSTQSTGGREFTTGVPIYSGPADTSSTSATTIALATFANAFSSASADITFYGVKANSNMPPFIIRKFCKKTASADGIPEGAVIAQTGSCGSGWTVDSSLSGRFVFGEGSGNLDADGTALSTRALNDVGGREYTTGLPATSAVGASSTAGPSVNLAQSPMIKLYDTEPVEGSVSGNLSDSNMPPYISLRACKSGSSGVSENLGGAVVDFDLASCPAGWSEYAQAKGRAILFSGFGNTDIDGAGLTSRALGSSGGNEFTTGLAVHINDPATLSAPAFDRSLCRSNSGAAYRANATPDTTVGGAKADSNMPPFLVLLKCIKD